jgi:hypothetical protein
MALLMSWIIVLTILMQTKRMQMVMDQGMFVIAALILTLTALATQGFLRTRAE